MHKTLNFFISQLVNYCMGSIRVVHSHTGREKVRRRIIPHSMEGTQENLKVILNCREIAHQTIYSRWFVLNRTYFSYAVEVSLFDNETLVETLPTRYYPLMCSRLFRWTTLPKVRAIEACLSELIGSIGKIASREAHVSAGN